MIHTALLLLFKVQVIETPCDGGKRARVCTSEYIHVHVSKWQAMHRHLFKEKGEDRQAGDKLRKGKQVSCNSGSLKGNNYSCWCTYVNETWGSLYLESSANPKNGLGKGLTDWWGVFVQIPCSRDGLHTYMYLQRAQRTEGREFFWKNFFFTTVIWSVY